MEMEAMKKIIVALDVDSLDKAKPILKCLAPLGVSFKIGLNLITSVGVPQAVSFVRLFSEQVILDGKFCDTPKTMGHAARAAARLGVKAFTIHASSGKESIEAAVANKGDSLVLGVTVLTSINKKECLSIFGDNLNSKVLQFSLDLLGVGAEGIICSPRELKFIGKFEKLDDLLKITPGIRPKWAPTRDQKRFMNPAKAIRAGATALIIGDPILNTPVEIGTSVDAAKKIAKEISKVL